MKSIDIVDVKKYFIFLQNIHVLLLDIDEYMRNGYAFKINLIHYTEGH